MIFKCEYCGMYFSNPTELKHHIADPRGWGYNSYVELRDHCPYCGGDDLDYFDSLIEYKGRYYQDRLHLASHLRKRGYTDDEIKKAQDEAIEIWEVDDE